ncbi:MAG: malonic semialdehyde reductase [Hyphomicrobiaceae bacterium]
MPERLAAQVIDQLLLAARTQNKWQDRDVPDHVLRDVFDVLRMGPTSANCSPARFVFVKSEGAKRRLEPLVSRGNTEKTMTAPVTAIIGYDLNFFEHLPHLFPHNTDAKNWFNGNDDLIEETAFRNGTLQAAYLIVTARMFGLDVGGMSGFDNAGVDAEFFSGTTVKSNFLLNIGYGDPRGVFPRSPRFEFDDVAQVI